MKIKYIKKAVKDVMPTSLSITFLTMVVGGLSHSQSLSSLQLPFLIAVSIGVFLFSVSASLFLLIMKKEMEDWLKS